jgi:type I site-specific restriction endonuclease
MNMTLHGIDNPDIRYKDSLAQEHAGDSDRYSLVLANPPMQIEFINMVIEHLTDQGVMDPALLYETPFTDVAPTGPDQLFDEEKVARLFTKIRGLNDSAVA